MRKIRILLADDHTLVRKGLKALLEDAKECEVVGEAANGRETLSLVEECEPDVILMDISMPLLGGLEATRQVCEQFPNVKVVILTIYTNEEYIMEALRAGASGYMLKEAAPRELLQAIKIVHRGDAYISPSISRKLIKDYVEKSEQLEPDTKYASLTKREREVLHLVAEGRHVQEIAELLSISEKTVRTYRNRLMHKLNLRTISEMTMYAIRRGLIILDSSPEGSERFFLKK